MHRDSSTSPKSFSNRAYSLSVSRTHPYSPCLCFSGPLSGLETAGGGGVSAAAPLSLPCSGSGVNVKAGAGVKAGVNAGVSFFCFSLLSSETFWFSEKPFAFGGLPPFFPASLRFSQTSLYLTLSRSSRAAMKLNAMATAGSSRLGLSPYSEYFNRLRINNPSCWSDNRRNCSASA